MTKPGKLYFGDNLEVLRGENFRTSSVDLVYLDPPFNSNRAFNVLFQERDLSSSRAQIKAFEDCWHWDQEAQSTFEDLTGPDANLRGIPTSLSVLMRALHESMPKRNDMLAYLVMMAPRLVELHRVLKPSGSLYLHCDPTASHYLKLVLDCIFGLANFGSEIIWQRTNSRSTAGRWPRVHDVLLFYFKGDRPRFNPVLVPGDPRKLPHTLITGKDGQKYNTHELTGPGVTKDGGSGKPWRGFDPAKMGRHWANAHAVMDQLDNDGLIHWPARNGFPRRRAAEPFRAESRTVTVGDVWTDIDRLNQTAKERLGYPTQKPVALLERILEASTSPGDIVLDPFCGCGTTIDAAQKLGREWIGIDITHLAIKVVRDRMGSRFPGVEYELLGEPQDVESARVLAEVSPYEFQWWMVHRVRGRPVGAQHGGREGKRGKDRGVDGFLKFATASGVQEVILSVKGGRSIGSAMVRDLRGTIERQKAAIGVLLTMYKPTAEMKREAIDAGFVRYGNQKYPRLQILSAEDLFDGKTIAYPRDSQQDTASGHQRTLPGLDVAPPPPRKGVRIKVPHTVSDPTALATRRRPKLQPSSQAAARKARGEE